MKSRLREIEVILVLLALVRTVAELGVLENGLCGLLDSLSEPVIGLNSYPVFLTLEFIFNLLIVRSFILF